MKSNEQVDVKESNERKKSISSFTLDHKIKRTNFENDKFDFCEYVITKNIERQLHINNEFIDFGSKN